MTLLNKIEFSDSALIDVAVIIPTFNRCEMVCEAVDAVLRQNTRPREIIIIDDGSEDDTAQRIDTAFHGRVHYIQQQNSGQAAARARGIAAATAHWIAFCDSDDLWDGDHLTDFARAVKYFPAADCFFSDFREFSLEPEAEARSKLEAAPPGWLDAITAGSDSSGELRLLGPAVYGALIAFQPIFPSTLVFSRPLYERLGGIDESIGRIKSEDAHLIRRLAAHGCMALCTRPSVWIRKHSGNYSADHQRNLEGKLLILEHLVKRGQIPPHCVPLTEQAILKTALELFRASYWNGDYGRTLQAARRLPAGTLTVLDHLRCLKAMVRAALSRDVVSK
jgi:GT2 family glycosyltransferase